MKEMLGFVLAIGAAYWFWPREEIWLGTVYADAGNLVAFEHVGEFASLAACLDGVYTKLNTFNDPSAADFECGLNCEPYLEGSDLLICEETRDTP